MMFELQRPARRPRRSHDIMQHTLEPLEQRALLSFAYTPQEVYLAELVNRARANPLAEGGRLGINLMSGLSSAEQARLVGQQPLALNQSLTIAARAHAADMAARAFFDHVNPDGQSPTQRALAAGYAGSAGENIGAGFFTIDAVHRAWLESVGHRKNVLSLHQTFGNSFHYDEFGPAIAQGVGGPYNHYYAESFGIPTNSGATRYLLGVVINDQDNDAFYDIGEGRAGVRIDVAWASAPDTVIATFTTDSAGNYQIPLGAGAYSILFTDTSTGRTFTSSATIGNWNVKVDARIALFSLPVDPDDHANAGQWAQASTLLLTSDGTTAVAIGSVSLGGDTDLFRFTAPRAGPASLTLTSLVSTLTQRIRVLDANGNEIAATTGAPGGGTQAVVNFNAAAGATYFVVVDAANTPGSGLYQLTFQGPAADDPVDPEDPEIPVVTDIERPRPGVQPMLGTDADGRMVMTYLSAADKPIYAVRNDEGAWEYTDLSTRFAAQYTGRVLHWRDSLSGSMMVAARANKGVIVFRLLDDGTWRPLNITGRAKAGANIGSELTLIFDDRNLATLAGLSKTGRILTFIQLNSMTAAGNPRFVFRNITTRDLIPRGVESPTFGGCIVAWTTPRGTMNLAAVSPDGQVMLYWKNKGVSQRWTGVNLSEYVGLSASLTGNLTAFQTPGRGMMIVGVDGEGATFNLGWRANLGWTFRPLADLEPSSPSPAQVGSLSSYVSRMGPAYVATVTDAGELQLFRYRTNGNSWTLETAALEDTLTLGAMTTSFHDALTGTTYIVATNVGGDFILLSMAEGGETWTTDNLSHLLAA